MTADVTNHTQIPAWMLCRGPIEIGKTAFLLSRQDFKHSRRVWKIVEYSPGLTMDFSEYDYHGFFENRKQATQVLALLVPKYLEYDGKVTSGDNNG